jgi:CO/xanthine dehydrogenase Mo-binding subunit
VGRLRRRDRASSRRRTNRLPPRGRTVQSNFNDYLLLRSTEAPAVEVHIVDSREESTGFGEIALPPCAGAIANAVYAATGKANPQAPTPRLTEPMYSR